jgi:very-short-patch-repair endonuclease
LRYDFLLKHKETNKLIIIELDGLQHIPYFHRNGEKDFEYQQERDLFKMNKALENNINLIRVRQTDIWNNCIDNIQLIFTKITHILSNNEPTVHFVPDADIWG